MRSWVDAVNRAAGDDLLWNEGHQYGDWLDPLAPPEDPFAALTPAGLVATAYFAKSTRLLASAASVLGESGDSERYYALATSIEAAFREEYVGEDLERLPRTQTALALALEFGLVERPDLRVRIGDLLASLMREGGHRIGTGFVGTSLICDALTHAGYLQDAFGLLLQRECPSWLYPVTMGATTIWERWDSLLPDGTVNPGEMTSFNHYALGAVADWMQRTLGGIAPTAPGYTSVAIHPRFPSAITSARAHLDSPSGRIATDWAVEQERFTLTVQIPHGVEATITLPSGETALVAEAGRHEFSEPAPERG